jgi:hypothetical protein
MSDRINTIDELKAFVIYAILAKAEDLEFMTEYPKYQIICAVFENVDTVAQQIERNTGIQFMKIMGRYMAKDKARNVSILLNPANKGTSLIANLDDEYMKDMAQYANP